MAQSIGLMRAIGFDLSDLEANQKGCISPKQWNRLRSNNPQQIVHAVTAILSYALVIIGLFVGIMLVAALRGFITTGTISLKWNDELNTIALALLVPVIITTAYVTTLYSRQWLQLRTDLKNGKVYAAAGTIRLLSRQDMSKLRQRWSLSTVPYRLQISDLTFDVSINTWSEFSNNTYYTVYYLPVSKIIVSVQG